MSAKRPQCCGRSSPGEDNPSGVPASNNDPDLALARAAAQAYSPRPLTDGERWTVEALFQLRRCGYRPAAWMRFIRKSLQRSAQARNARPQMARQADRWGAVGAAGWLATCHLARDRPGLSINRAAGLLWWLSVWRMLDWHLGMAEGGDGRPHERLSPADALTLTRFRRAHRLARRGCGAPLRAHPPWQGPRYHSRPGVPRNRRGLGAQRRAAFGARSVVAWGSLHARNERGAGGGLRPCPTPGGQGTAPGRCGAGGRPGPRRGRLAAHRHGHACDRLPGPTAFDRSPALAGPTPGGQGTATGRGGACGRPGPRRGRLAAHRHRRACDRLPGPAALDRSAALAGMR